MHLIRTDRRIEIGCGRTIVTVGALQSKAIVMRSGIGLASDLREAEIPVTFALEGVGANLQDHPAQTLVQFPAIFMPRVRRRGRVSTWNRIVPSILGSTMELPAQVPRELITVVLSSGTLLNDMLEGDQALDEYVRKS